MSPSVLRLRVHNLHLDLQFVSWTYENSVVQVEVDSKGKHPYAWATKALNSDPGSYSAFRVTINDSGQGACNVPHKANGFIDWMAGDTYETVASRPQRYERIPDNVMNVPAHMKPFVGGRLH